MGIVAPADVARSAPMAEVGELEALADTDGEPRWKSSRPEV
jgi:hypothetical protein